MGLLGSLYVDVGINNKMGSEVTSISTGLVALENKMKGVAGSMATSFDGTIGKLRQMPNEVKYLGAALSLGLTAPLVAFGSTAVKTFSSFDDSMRQVGAVTGATGSQFQTLSALAREMGETTSFKASEAADAMTYLGMAGFKTDEIIGALPATLALARAGVLDLGSAADIMSNVMTIFGMRTDEAGHAADVLAKVAHSTNTNVQQVGEAMTYAGPVAHSFGLSMEMTAAAVGMLGNAGIQASMAGTTLRGILTELVSPTKASMDVFSQYGLTLDQLDPKVHGLDEIFRTLKESGMSSADMMKVFGLRAGPGLLALLDQGIDKLGSYSIELQNVEGYAESAAEKMDEGFGGAVRMMESALESFSITIGNRLAVIFNPFVDFITAAASAFAQMNPVGQTALVILGGLALAIGPVLLGMAALPMIVEGVTLAMGFLGITTAGVVGALSSIVLPVAAVVAALYLIEAKTGLVTKAWSLFSDMATIVWEGLKRTVSGAIDYIGGMLDDLSSMLSGGFLGGLGEAIGGLAPYFSKFTEWVGGFVEDIHITAEEYRNGTDEIKETTEETGSVVDAASDVAGDAYYKWGTYARDMASEVVSANDEAVSSTQEATEAYDKAVSEFMQDINAKTSAGISFMSGTNMDELARGIRTVNDELIILDKNGQLVKVSADGALTPLKDMGMLTFETPNGGITIFTDGITDAQVEGGTLDRIINDMRNDVVVLDNTKLDNLQGEITETTTNISDSQTATITWEDALANANVVDFGALQGEVSDTRGEVEDTTSSTDIMNSTFINTDGLVFSTIQANVSTVGELTDDDTKKVETLNTTLNTTNYSPFSNLFGNLGTAGIAIDTDKKKTDDANTSLSKMGGFSFSTTLSSLGSVGKSLDTIYEKAKTVVSELFKIGSSSGSSSSGSSSISGTSGVTKSGGSGTGEGNVKVVSTVNKQTINYNGDKISASNAKSAGL